MSYRWCIVSCDRSRTAMHSPVLIFDLDGTLTDPSEGITRCILHALKTLNCPLPERVELERLIGPPLHESFAKLLGSSEDADRAVGIFRERYGVSGLFENRVYPGVSRALEELKRTGAIMFVATSKPREYALRIMDSFGLSVFFKGIHGSEMSGHLSDKTMLLDHVLRTEQLPRHRSVMIGDRWHDVAAAKANGTLSLGITWGFGSVEELRNSGADVLCHSPGDLRRCCRELGVLHDSG